MGKSSEANLGKFWFFNSPRRLFRQDYSSAMEKIVDRYSKNDELLAIYDWGSPSNPGISDLDIVFVMRDDAKNPLSLGQRSFMCLDGKTRYIARHPFVFISENGFGDIPYVYPRASLRKIWGKSIGIKKISKNEEKGILHAVLNDIVIRHYPRDFLHQQMGRKINVRDSMLRLNSLKYTFATLEKLRGKGNFAWEGFAKDVSRLREEWFEKKDEKKLAALCDEAVGITMEIIEAAMEIMEGNYGQLTKSLPEKISYSGIKNSTLFLKKWESGFALEKMRETIKRKMRDISILPVELAPQLLFYGGQQGKISAHIRKNLHPFVPIEMSGSQLARRMGVLNGQAELAYRLRHSDFPAFFDFGYRNTSGINNTALRMLDSIRF